MTVTQNTISPIDDRIYVSRQLADKQTIDDTLTQAKIAQRQWSLTPLATRQAICNKAVEWLEANKEEIGLELCWQMGRPIRFASAEIDGVVERARYMIDISETVLKPILLPEKNNFTRYITREPVGVVFVVAPWNYPYLTAINSIIPALLAGNSVILKHSAQTPLCAERLVSAFQQAGLPDGVFRYLHLSHDDTQKIIQSKRVDYVAFTGSVEGGRKVEQAAVGAFIGVGLELGGKDPAYIRADADLDAAVETVIDGAFFNSGQSCCGIERIYVHHSIYDDVVNRAVAIVNQYRLGRPDEPNTTLGPVVRADAANFIRDQVKDAVDKGAIAHIDQNAFMANKIDSPYLAPQVLTQVDHSMRVMNEESFGPVVGIMSVNDDQQAIQLMNDSDFGLTASIFTQDVDTGVALGNQLETGTFFLNRCDYLDPALAWTGVKQSGRGCSLSQLGFEALTRPKSFHIKHG